jgi:hypothetical protein
MAQSRVSIPSMAEELTTGAASAAFHCPWCSAVLPSTDLEICPSCKATLTSTGEAALPGVTAIDHEALLRTSREPRPQRSRILSWLSGEYVEETATPAEPQAIAPPDLEVRREILRLELEAEIADKQAEADSILADAAVEGRPLPGLEPVEADDAEVTEDVIAASNGDVPDADAAPELDLAAVKPGDDEEPDKA